MGPQQAPKTPHAMLVGVPFGTLKSKDTGEWFWVLPGVTYRYSIRHRPPWPPTPVPTCKASSLPLFQLYCYMRGRRLCGW